ncbi:mechanosensitive ion channel protein MscS [Bacillus canaveralius]|uniref:Mechanosensitive ion channel protein MscS n=1 Tax=Bacillus canaveralius TaxID=1403243 RepID=A0A2N5GGT4_9BACI|nr:mechanosensitive ion channel family protein [Bacillus canaveralius]PLR79974.1 mechanosensitive ion channel protein MscS [Bacillus canaveralius]PLR89979.1 mechanosensitive ion channel protein MscS [Bacillus canaveralius]RSK52136.1 mechanosensitive ion channel family protein [Bacillus canaveralius]
MKKELNEFLEKILSDEFWILMGQGFLKILAIILLTGVVIRIGRLAIRNIFKVRTRSPLRISERREATLMKLLENILSYVVYFIAFIMILSTLTINVTGILAGAGIAGLAIGFGAQNLVRDVITGFFIIFEDQFSVGDHVRVGQFEGTVEEIGLRTTKIKNWTGELHILPNGSITEVTNFSLHNSIAIVDVSIAYEGDIERAEKIISDLLETLPAKYEDLVNPPELLGVHTLNASEVVLRVVAETLPMRHFGVARMLRKDIKICLDEHGMDVPYPRLVMYSRHEEELNKRKQLGKE